MNGDPLLDDLNPDQRRAVETVEGPLLIIAGAGSGKTRVLTQRFAHLVASRHAHPSEILAITFTNRAAKEMVERVQTALGRDSRGLWVMTFHAACARILRSEAEAIGFRPAFTIYDQADQVRLVKRVLEDDLGKDPKRYPPRGLHARISDAKNRQIGPEEFAAAASGFFEETVAEAYGHYQRRLHEAGAMDFDDLLMKTVQLFEDERHGDVRERWQAKFKFVMVDEYQDTNHAQYRLVRILAARHGNVCVVGDGDQSIYSWRGADMRNILDFERDYPDATVIRLEQNYRSTQAILDAANAVISHNRERQEKRLWSELGRGEPVRVVECEDETAEANLIVSEIQRLIQDGASASEVAVLYRANAQSRAIEDQLRKRDMAYQVLGGLRFYDRAEIRDALGYLQAIANPADAITLRRIVNSPRRGIGDTSLQRLQARADTLGLTLREALREPEAAGVGPAGQKAVLAFSELLDRLSERAAAGETVGELLDSLLDDTGYRESLRAERTVEAEGKLENLEELVGVARAFDLRDEEEGRDLATFLQELSLVSDQDADEHLERPLVSLMTLHSAKGLEFPIVFLPGLEDNVFPHIRAIEEANLEEERRLCYVGMTRAGRRLTATFCRQRTLFGMRASNPPSIFISEMDPAAIELVRLRSDPFGRGRPGGDRRPRTYGSTESVWTPPARPRDEAGGPRITGVERRDEIPLLSAGDTVRHKKWGEGIVIRVRTAEEVVVRFPAEGEKVLLVAYAPIEKV